MLDWSRLSHHLLPEHLFLQVCVFRDDFRTLGGVFDGDKYSVEVQRLLDEVESAFLDAFYSRVDVPVSGNHYDSRVDAVFLQLLQHFRTFHIRHLDITENDIVPLFSGHIQCRRAILGGIHGVTFVGQYLFQ